MPSLQEYLDVLPRKWARNRYSVRLKACRIAGWDEERAWNKLRESEHRILENDTPELRAKDEDIIRRSRGVHCPTAEVTAAHAEDVRRKLRSMVRVTFTE